VGLFALTNVNAVIQDLRVEDSYIQGGGFYVGSIAGYSAGTQYTNVYSCAIVKGGSAMTGGLVGAVQSAGGTFSSCWYDGVMKLSDNGCQAGGIVGVVRNDTCAVTMNNCLNTGNIDSSLDRTDHWIGGLVGALRIVTPNVTIRNSLNVGTITVAGDASDGIGAIVGHVDAGTLDMNHTVYGITGDYEALGSANTGTTVIDEAVLVARENLLGDNAIANASALFADGTTWTTVIDDIPALKAFVKESALTADTSWYNVNKKTFTIDTASELLGFAKLSKTTDFKGKTVRLGRDIALNVGKATDWATNEPINVWTPIANFAGTFDGQGHTISGLYVKSSEKVGLFSITTNATIKNLQLKNCYIHATGSWAGSVVGQSKGGTFDTIYADTIVQGDVSVVGGIIGDIVETVVVDNCWFAGTVNPSGSAQDAAGIVGRVDGVAHITDCLNTGTIQANSNSGGVVGRVCSGKTLAVSNSVNTGSFGSGNNVGAILGNNAGTAKVASCYSINDYNLVGTGTVSEYNNSVLAKESMQGDAALALTGLDFTDDWVAKTGATPELRSFTSEDGNLTADPTQVYTGWYNTWDSEYTITTKAGFYGMATLESTTTQYSGKTVKLGADIVMNEGSLDPKGNSSEWQTTIANWDKWTPIDLRGTFDGQGHEIRGLYVNYSTNGAGIFNDTYDGSMVKNLRLVDSYITGTGDHVGSIAGWGYGSFESIYSDAIVVASSGKNYVGGLVGTNKSGAIDKMSYCWFDGTIVASGGYVGGLLGYVNDATTFAIQNCLFTGTLKNTSTTAKDNGGLCGNIHSNSTLNITNCLMAGTLDIDAGSATGKVVGNCAGTANVTGVYSLASDYADAGTGTVTGTIASCTREQLTGDAAKTSAPALFYDGTYWKTTNDLPVLGDSPTYEVEDSEATLINIPLSRYRIVVSESASTLTELLAEYLKTQITEKSGVTLEIVKDSVATSEYEIVLGNTDREISTELYDEGVYNSTDYSYAIKNVGSSIQLGYSDSPALVDAFNVLLESISDTAKTSFDVKYSYDMSEVEKAEDSYVRVMSSNIYNSLDTSFDYLGMPYQARAELLAECYLLYKPDFIGWQEADKAMRDEVYKYIAHEYQMVEFDMSGNNWCPIFYRKDLYKLETSDYYQFSQFDANSNVVLDSMHYCEWALYSSKSNPEEQFIHMNIHYNVSERSALPQAVIVNKMIQKLMAQYPEVPIAITGDYNFTATESVFKTMMRGIDDKVQSGSQILNNEDSKYYTWHVLGNLNLSETYGTPVKQRGPIDHVSITTNLLEAKEYKIIHYPLICWAADHYPIFLDVAVK